MGPHRIIHNRRGYLTETYYDNVSARFSERPFPLKARMEPPPPSNATEGPKSTQHETNLHGLARDYEGPAEIL